MLAIYVRVDTFREAMDVTMWVEIFNCYNPEAYMSGGRLGCAGQQKEDCPCTVFGKEYASASLHGSGTPIKRYQ